MSFWKNVSSVGTTQPGSLSGGDPYSLKMPPAPQSGQSAVVQSWICAGLKSITLRAMLTFSVRHRQPAHQSSAGEPVFWPANVVVLIFDERRLALQLVIVNGPLAPPSTSVQVLSEPSVQKRPEFCHRNMLPPPLLISVFPLMTDVCR